MSSRDIAFEAEPAEDATDSRIRVSRCGIRITFPNGDIKYYYGLGAKFASHAHVEMGPIPELEGKHAPKPSASLLEKYWLSQTGIGTVASGTIQLGHA